MYIAMDHFNDISIQYSVTTFACFHLHKNTVNTVSKFVNRTAISRDLKTTKTFPVKTPLNEMKHF